MTLQDVKTQIESKVITSDVIIFKITDNDFIPTQYIREISKIKKKDIMYIDSIEDALGDSFSIFEDAPAADVIRVLKVPLFEVSANDFLGISNLIVITEKFDNKEVEADLKNFIVEVPKLLDWQTKDYAYSLCDGADAADIDVIVDLYGKDIYRIDQEVSKISIFNPSERKYLVKDLIRDGSFSDTTNYTIFNFTNAIIKRDLDDIKSIYVELSKMDLNGFGLCTILLRNFRNLIMVKMTVNPTPENTGLDSKQLYAVRKISTPYTAEQIVKSFEMLSDIDRQIKTGELPPDLMVDYMLVKILTM